MIIKHSRHKSQYAESRSFHHFHLNNAIFRLPLRNKHHHSRPTRTPRWRTVAPPSWQLPKDFREGATPTNTNNSSDSIQHHPAHIIHPAKSHFIVRSIKITHSPGGIRKQPWKIISSFKALFIIDLMAPGAHPGYSQGRGGGAKIFPCIVASRVRKTDLT